MKQYWYIVVLGLIFAFGLFLRTWQLPFIPVGLHGDEASIGYNAYSLLKTGKDQNSIPWPLAIDQFGDFRPAGYHYLDIPFVKFFGLNALAVRLPSAFFGALTIPLLYFLVYELFKKKSLALTAASFLAISPWHINISRATSEGIVAGFFIILGFWALLSRRLPLSIAAFIISFLFYHTARVFVPVFLLLYFLSSRKKATVIVLIITCILLGGIMKMSQGAARPTTVSIFNIPGGDREITQQIGEDGTRPAIVTRILHNKALFYGRLFLASYFWHFNGEFLFDSTGKPVRYSIPWSANMYLIDLPLLLLGVAVLLIDGLRSKKYYLLIPLLWLLVAALPAGLTWEDLPNVQRASLMIPAFIMICSYGLFEILSFSKKRLFILFIYGGFLFYGFILFFHNYFYHLPRHEPWHRSAATPELITTIANLKKNYPLVIMTTESNNNFIFYLFYSGYDPVKFQQAGSPKERDGLKFEGIRYAVAPCPLGGDSEAIDEDITHVGILFVNLGRCKTPINAKILQTVRWTDGMPAYQVVAIDPNWIPLR